MTTRATGKGQIRDILHSRQLTPKKRLGQNFLVHQPSAQRIVDLAAISSEDTILEIGVGLGSLTRVLAEKAKKVIGLEIDRGIVSWLEEQGNLPDNVILLHQDVMKADFKGLTESAGGRLKIVANLPYSLSNPLLFKFIAHHEMLEWAVIMLQKEVGDRLLAGAGSRTYGILSVLVRSCASVEPLLVLGPGNFHPRPKVDSQVLRIIFHPVPNAVRELPEHDHGLLHAIVNAAFQQRRKTLLNSLSAGNIHGLDKTAWKHIIEQSGISAQTRPELLTTGDFVSITRIVQGTINS